MGTTKRCHILQCNRKLKLSDDFPCKCGQFFCPVHKFRTQHNCMYNYKEEQQKKLEKQNPKVEPIKIEKI